MPKKRDSVFAGEAVRAFGKQADCLRNSELEKSRVRELGIIVTVCRFVEQGRHSETGELRSEHLLRRVNQTRNLEPESNYQIDRRPV